MTKEYNNGFTHSLIDGNKATPALNLDEFWSKLDEGYLGVQSGNWELLFYKTRDIGIVYTCDVSSITHTSSRTVEEMKGILGPEISTRTYFYLTPEAIYDLNKRNSFIYNKKGVHLKRGVSPINKDLVHQFTSSCSFNEEVL